MSATTEYDMHDKQYFEATVKGCANCGTTSANGAYLNDVWLTDGRRVVLCDECAAEDARIEAQADALALLPSCEARMLIINTAKSTGELVNRLSAHDMIQCVNCASTVRTVEDDRLHVDTAAVCCEGRAVA